MQLLKFPHVYYFSFLKLLNKTMPVLNNHMTTIHVYI